MPRVLRPVLESPRCCRRAVLMFCPITPCSGPVGPVGPVRSSSSPADTTITMLCSTLHGAGCVGGLEEMLLSLLCCCRCCVVVMLLSLFCSAVLLLIALILLLSFSSSFSTPFSLPSLSSPLPIANLIQHPASLPINLFSLHWLIRPSIECSQTAQRPAALFS